MRTGLPKWFLLTGFAAFACGSSRAGLLSSPPPRFESTEPLRVIYRMGAIYFEPGRIDTVVTCVNEDTSTAEVAFELFDPSDAPTGVIVHKKVLPGGEVSFVTSALVGAEGRLVVPSLSTLDSGKARVSASTTKLSCRGFWRARSADGTTKDNGLQLMKKVAYDVEPK